MECNKEEAIRAKEIAEKKMQDKDFVGARKIVLKAQQLYSELENISQMLTVCDVHCSAEHKVMGTELNWYKILQVEQTADEASIKKQYRKLALLLHPDKNKFSGAEAAFKLIGEANRVLSDPAKRSGFDMKYKGSMNAAIPRQPPQPRYRNPSVRTQPGMNNGNINFGANAYQQQSRQNQPGFTSDQHAFWTACPFCSMRYQYYKDVLNRALRCQNCENPFIAYDLNVHGVQPPAANWSQPSVPRQNQVPSQKNFTSNMGFQGHYSHESKASVPSQKTGGTSVPSQKSGLTSVPGGASTTKVDGNVNAEGTKEGDGKPKFKAEKPNKNRKRGKNTDEEPSGSCDTESSTDSDEYENVYVGGGANAGAGGHYARRSSRQKQHVSYNEDLSDDDLKRPSKRSKGIKSSTASETMKPDGSGEDKEAKKQNGSGPSEESLPNGHGKAEECRTKGNEAEVVEDDTEINKVNSKVESDADDKSKPDPEFFDVPDPDFYDFDKDRTEDSFAINQMWAIYDDVDGMPRFYARIKKVYSPGFKVQITWLEADPEDDDGIDWFNEGLPVACGIFKHGKSETTEDLGMFSYLVPFEKGSRRNTYNMYPRKGDIWALFKNWDRNWSSDADNHRNYEFEFVQVLSDYVEGSAISVAYLVKVKGFVSLFRLKDHMGPVDIPSNELLRFSHRVPSYRTTGEERENVPQGYFELDPASLPEKLEEVNMEAETMGSKINSSCSKTPLTETNIPEMRIDPDEKNLHGMSDSVKQNQSPSEPSKDNETCSDGTETKHNIVPEDSVPSSPESCVIPDTKFYCFDIDRTLEKFESGQIWALFCDLDSLPKYYALITKVQLIPYFQLGVKWIEPCSQPKDIVQWSDKEIPVCCGMFELGQSQVFTDTCTFSHQSSAKAIGRNTYEIYPRKGEVWALYKNFNSEWKHTDLVDCEYEMVEVLEANDVMTKVLPLELVDGYKTVFKAKRISESPVASVIPRADLLRFSHRVPAFRIIEEGGGIHKGSWELDPKSMPACLFR